MAKLTVVEPAGPTAVAQLVEEYLDHCRAKGLSPRTVKTSYGYPLRSVLLPWCGREGITQPNGLTTRALARLTAELPERGRTLGQLSPHSFHAYTRPVHHFLR